MPLELAEVGGEMAEAAVRELQELLGGHTIPGPAPAPSSSTTELFGLEQPELELASAFDDKQHDLGPQECTLVQSVVEYRSLKDRLERGQQVKEYERLQLGALERRFREGDPGLSANRRQWRRFDCRASGLGVVFRDLSSRTVPIVLTDLGAGGARFLAGDLVFAHGDVVSLIVDLSRSERRQAVFTSRVAWINQVDFAFGVVFCGSARLEARIRRRR